MNILDNIIASKVKEIAFNVEKTPVSVLEKGKFFDREILPLTNYLLNRDKTGIIAEFKRKSPSKGMINPDADVKEVTRGYAGAGASAISVLTDTEFFGGSPEDLEAARESCSIPILRKDFIIDEYQIVEAKASGADAVLLIASALDAERARNLARFARSFGLQVLFEIHTHDEIGKANEYIDIIGVNNRDLSTFKVDINMSFRMAEKIPDQYIRISESGIRSYNTIIKLREAGYHGFLIGEIFMRTTDPVKAFSDFVSKRGGLC
jgi:indole-3-glycerol phosphate synthase